MDTRLSLFLSILFSLFLFCLPSSPPTFCHENERSALLEFKKTYFNKTPHSCFYDDYETPKKIELWKMDVESGNCCAWDGIECDADNSHVIGVELGDSCLSGRISSNTTLFHLSNLEYLHLSSNKLAGDIPSSFINLTRLTDLDLSSNKFSGQIPSSITNLTQLTELYLYSNQLTGAIPSLIGQLSNLKVLYLYSNKLAGEIPSSITNLTQLTELYLYSNQLTGAIPYLIGQLSNLEHLDLDSNKLAGEIPSSFINLTRLTYLDLSSNQFSGQILPQLAKMPRLSTVHLAFNNFTGSIPRSISEHKYLQTLYLHSNNFHGTVQISLFLKNKRLSALFLSFNKLSLVDDLNDVIAYPKQFFALGLATCNLSRFPTFLQHQDMLDWLDLSSNSLSGEIPEWFLEMNTGAQLLNLSSNSLTSSAYRPLNFRWKFLRVLDLRNNYFKGSLPILPTSIMYYLISRNNLSGNIPSQICELRELRGLDLSENNLTGVFPQCLNNLSSDLQFLSLHHNNFTGEISSILGNVDCNFLTMVDVSGNQFHGSLPRSLTKCHNLEFLNLGSNRIKDVFPSWLGSLRFLRVLILHSNEFNGEIGKPENNDEFPSLQIVDLSSNNFQNCLPSMYFECWQAMKIPSSYVEDYMGTSPSSFQLEGIPLWWLDYTMIINMKGLKMSYPKIQSYLTFIDLSNNNFSCEIPRAIEDLTKVQYLNFSNNRLTGPIPSFLKALTNLQSLDLSQNKLNGKIPQDLTQLTFLETFNVSYNNLSGQIPEGRQFGTFDNNSYLGNTGLCGMPLSKKCGDVDAFPQPLPQSKGEAEDSIEIDWKIVLIGYGGGLIVGFAIGQRFPLKPPRCILKYFGRRAQIRRW